MVDDADVNDASGVPHSCSSGSDLVGSLFGMREQTPPSPAYSPRRVSLGSPHPCSPPSPSRLPLPRAAPMGSTVHGTIAPISTCGDHRRITSAAHRTASVTRVRTRRRTRQAHLSRKTAGRRRRRAGHPPPPHFRRGGECRRRRVRSSGLPLAQGAVSAATGSRARARRLG